MTLPCGPNHLKVESQCGQLHPFAVPPDGVAGTRFACSKLFFGHPPLLAYRPMVFPSSWTTKCCFQDIHHIMEQAASCILRSASGYMTPGWTETKGHRQPWDHPCIMPLLRAYI